jgi:lipid II:glycine glycyltransferase (peptidoglycan interpeptide bridge formation enzyme)
MEVREINEEELAAFLEQNEHLVFHTWAYKKFITDAFGSYTILGVVDNGVRLILPIVEIKSVLGNKVISSAYIEYGGFAGDEKYVDFLLEYLEKYNRSDYLEIRGGLDFESSLSSLTKSNMYKRFVLSLEGDVWKNIQKSKRKAIKKSLKHVEVKDVTDIDELYELYCKNMHRFGSPPYGKKYFHAFYGLVNSGHAKVLGSFYQGKLVSALLGFTYGDRVHILISVSDPAFREFRPSDAMHWKFIEWSDGYKFFDFGRVREESGQYEYKRKWGPSLLELPSYFKLWNVSKVPIVDPKKHATLVSMWKKLPLFVTKLIGHRVRKELGI